MSTQVQMNEKRGERERQRENVRCGRDRNAFQLIWTISDKKKKKPNGGNVWMDKKYEATEGNEANWTTQNDKINWKLMEI